MRSYIGGHQVVTAEDYLELALGTPVELWLGSAGESEEERAARQDAARDILADDPELPDRAMRLAVQLLEAHMPELLQVELPPALRRRFAARAGVAA